MNHRNPLVFVALSILCATTRLTAQANSPSLRIDFQEGAAGWRTVLDGVMGGRSSGRVSMAEPGVLAFTGELSLANNGGFSQMRTAVDFEDTVGAKGFVMECRGDGRTYKFDVRASNARMMAGAYQQDFATVAGEWIEVRLPIDGFELFSFGRKLRNAKPLDPGKIESIGVTLSDKKAGDFRLEIRSIAAYGDAAPARDGGTDLVSVAKAAGLNTLLDLVKAADLELPAEPVTIFAPTDDAFGALPDATVQALLQPEGRATLRQILTYHLAPGARSSADVLNMRSLASLAGQPLAIDYDTRSVAGAMLVAVDVPFDGGIVHVIDKVMMPETRSITQIAVATEQLSTLVTAVKAARFTDQLGSENGPWTVFAPVNSAFAKLPEGALGSLLETRNRADLTAVLGLHVVPGRIAARELLAQKRLTSYFGQPVEIALRDGRIQVGDGAAIVTADIQAGNGVIHLIDQVLLPEPDAVAASQEQRAVLVAQSLASEAAEICSLAVERGARLFNDGNPEACAAIYEMAIESMFRLAGDRLPAAVVQRLERTLREAEEAGSATRRAWAFRRGLDDVYQELQTAIDEDRLRPRRTSRQL